MSSRISRFSCLSLIALTCGNCCYVRPYRTPTDVERWQDPTPPQLSIDEKAHVFQKRIEARHQLPDGVIRYKLENLVVDPIGHHGNVADGAFYLGLYCSTQALRYSVTWEDDAKAQLLKTLGAMELVASASGEPGLLARHVAKVKPKDERWRVSTTQPGYFWRSDVSKDQYAGFAHGLAVALATVPDPGVRSRIAALAAPIADHFLRNDLHIVDWDGETTTFGNVQGRLFGFPAGVNALISLLVAKTAAVSTGEERFVLFYDRLVDQGYLRLARAANLRAPGGKRVNENMAFLTLYALWLLEEDQERAKQLRVVSRRLWPAVRDDRNAFFSFVQAAIVGSGEGAATTLAVEIAEARQRGLAALREFPDSKIAWPVDLTRQDFGVRRAFFNNVDCWPRARTAVPIYLRYRSSSQWVGDPYQMVGRLKNHGDVEYAGIDYLIAYWVAREHGFIAAPE